MLIGDNAFNIDIKPGKLCKHIGCNSECNSNVRNL